MSAHDTLNSLANELRALPRRQQRLILDALTPWERARMAALLSLPEVRASTIEVEAPADSLTEGYVSLIAERLHGARGGDAAVHSWKMTPAALRQMLAVAEEIQAHRNLDEPEFSQSGSPSLLGRLGSWMFPGRAGR
jgi:hypothetical protein